MATSASMRSAATSERPLTARGRATREKLVAAAAALVHERGIAGTSLDDVRAATGTSKSQLYHYFTDRSGLVQAVVHRQVDQVIAAQEPEVDELDSMAGLRRWRDRVLALHVDDSCARGCPLGRLAGELTDTDPGARAGLVTGFARWQDRIAAGLHRMQERGGLATDADPDALALGLLTAVQGGLLLARTARSLTPLQAALDLALDGVESHTPVTEFRRVS